MAEVIWWLKTLALEVNMEKLGKEMSDLISKCSKFSPSQIAFLMNISRLSKGESVDIIMGHIEAECYLTEEELNQLKEA
jgi:cytoplasmic iron level regulating protein YaaA (DUF328/UPF0246 family)